MIKLPNGMIEVSPKEFLEIMKNVEREAFRKGQQHLLAESQYITRKQAAAIRQVTPQTITEYVRKGLLKNYGKTGRYRFRLNEVNEASIKPSI